MNSSPNSVKSGSTVTLLTSEISLSSTKERSSSVRGLYSELGRPSHWLVVRHLAQLRGGVGCVEIAVQWETSLALLTSDLMNID